MSKVIRFGFASLRSLIGLEKVKFAGLARVDKIRDNVRTTCVYGNVFFHRQSPRCILFFARKASAIPKKGINLYTAGTFVVCSQTFFYLTISSCAGAKIKNAGALASELPARRLLAYALDPLSVHSKTKQKTALKRVEHSNNLHAAFTCC